MRKIIFVIGFLANYFISYAQVGIGTTAPKSQLDIAASSTSAPIATDGLLIPRVTVFPSGVTVDQNGMLVFLTAAFGTNQVGLYYYDFPSNSWKWMPTGNNANIWSNNTASSRIELPFLSNGITARPAGREFNILDNGNIGIGNTTPVTKFDVAGNVNLSSGLFYGGLSSPINLEITRAIPVIINDYVEIGNFSILHGAHSFRMSVTSNVFDSSESKSYIVSTKYNQTAGIWNLLNPISNSGPYLGNDFEIDIRVSNAVCFLRLRKTTGTIGGNAQIRIENTGSTADTFTNTSLTAATSPIPTVVFPNNTIGNPWVTAGNNGTSANTNFIGTTDNIDFVTRTNNTEKMRVTANGNIGVGNIAPLAKLDVTGNVNVTSGMYYGGLASPINIELTRIIPSGINDFIEIGNFNFSQGAHNFRISISNNTGAFSVAKTYIVSCLFNQTSNIWKVVSPVSNSGDFAGNDFDLDINVASQIASLRLRRVSGTAIPVAPAKIRVENLGSIADVFTSTTLTGNAAATPPLFLLNGDWSSQGNELTNANLNFIGTTDNVDFVTRTNNTEKMRVTSSGNVGIGIANPAAKLDIVGSQRITSANSANAVMESYVFQRNLASTTSSYTEIANFDVTAKTNRNINLEVNIISSHSGGGISSKYIINGNFNDVNGVGWRELTPISTTGDRGGLIVLDIGGSLVTGSNTIIQLRLRTGATLSQASIPVTVEIKSVNNPFLAEVSGAGTDASIVPLYNNTVLTQYQGRVGIGANIPNQSAILDISSTTKGVLLPRMTRAERNAIVKVAGLMIYQTDNVPGLRVCNGANWIRYTETVD